jgi:hypothetical protein
MKAGFCKSAICFPTAPLVVAEEQADYKASDKEDSN